MEAREQCRAASSPQPAVADSIAAVLLLAAERGEPWDRRGVKEEWWGNHKVSGEGASSGMG